MPVKEEVESVGEESVIEDSVDDADANFTSMISHMRGAPPTEDLVDYLKNIDYDLDKVNEKTGYVSDLAATKTGF